MGIFSKLFRKNQSIQPVQATLSLSRPMSSPNRWGEPTRVDVILKVIQYTDADKNEQVRISMSGIGNMNVCLASFLTKGVSYAQEKYNEYQANKDTDSIVEEPKAEKPRRERIASPTQREIEEMRAWAKAKQAERESK
jgi:hypothetical protein